MVHLKFLVVHRKFLKSLIKYSLNYVQCSLDKLFIRRQQRGPSNIFYVDPWAKERLRTTGVYSRKLNLIKNACFLENIDTATLFCKTSYANNIR